MNTPRMIVTAPTSGRRLSKPVRARGGAEPVGGIGPAGVGGDPGAAIVVVDWPGVPVVDWPGVPVVEWPGVPVVGWPGAPAVVWSGLCALRAVGVVVYVHH